MATQLAIAICPTKKKPFASKADAIAFEAHARETYGNARQYAYQCEECPDWHLSSMSPDAHAMATSRTNWSRIENSLAPAPPASALPHRGRPVGWTNATVVERRQRVQQLHAQGVKVADIAARLGITLGRAYADVKKAQSSCVSKLDLYDLDSITKQEELLRTQLQKLASDKQRLIELKELKLTRCWEGKGILIKKEHNQLALTIEDCNTLVEKMMEMLSEPEAAGHKEAYTETVLQA